MKPSSLFIFLLFTLTALSVPPDVEKLIQDAAKFSRDLVS